MSLPVATRIARRELRGGLQGFRIFLACLLLGVGAIAAVGTVRVSIEQGLQQEGATILGGDAEVSFTHRSAGDEEQAWLAATARALSKIIDFRSMAVVERGEEIETGLTQIKAVDAAYPLYGTVVLKPDMPLADALSDSDGLPGAVMQQILIDRLGLTIGDQFRLGEQAFRLTAALIREPDSAGSGFGLGPRTIVATTALEHSGLIQPGSLFEMHYRMLLAQDADLDQLKSQAEDMFSTRGLRWRDSRNGAPGIQLFVERIASFLVIVGLAGLAVGGVGVSAAVRAYLGGKTATIATLKTLGADGRTIFQIYMIQIGVLTVLGVGLGVAFGALVPLAFSPLIAAALPIPADFTLHFEPLFQAAVYGFLTAILFTLWPLAKARDVRAASLFRDAAGRINTWPRRRYILMTGLVLAALIGVVTGFSEIPKLALWATGGIVAALMLLMLAALGLRKLAGWMGGSKWVRGKPALRLALGAIGGPGSEAVPVVLSLGLGLTVLAAIGQIDTNLRSAIARDLPAVAPAYFFIDIQKDQLDGFLTLARSDAGVTQVDTAPMLRGVITHINDIPASEVAGDHWVIRGDRGITYAQEPPANSQVTQGAWWPADYTGPPLVSFAEEEANEIGLSVGDMLTVNILGRDITARIANFRAVDFSDASINFVITMNPSALAGAPHSSIATVYASEESEAGLLRKLMREFPNITAIRVRDAIARVSTALNGIAAATSYAAAATLLTGFAVLIGAAAAGERARTFEAAVLKTVGASRRRILTSFMLRAAMLGAAAGLVALLGGAVVAWGVISFVMGASYQFDAVSALTIVAGGAGATLLSGLAFAWRPLAARPAHILRMRE
ncbi:MAG: FtsX-like permease family protein [Marinosulfonomonas sp.]|nr:FtsX-like permease family protein [Marinosulfonomonas sp.]